MISESSGNRSLGISPAELGLSSQFSHWRHGQEGAILDVIECDTRIHATAMPTGWGKSVWYIASALLLGLRCCVLTSTKALQDQLLKDFREIGMVDIRGRANYPCCVGGGYTCDEGRHARCPRQQTKLCPYKSAYTGALQSSLVTTNYSYWIYQHLYGEGLGPFDLLVCDEAHDAHEEICSAMAVTFTTKEVYGLLVSAFPKSRDNIAEWAAWALRLIPCAQTGTDECRDRVASESHPPKRLVAELASWRNLVNKLKSVAAIQNDWAIQASSHGITLTPLWPSDYAEQVLFRHIPKIFLVSATIRPKTLEILGVANETDFREYPPVFAPSHSPVYFCKTNNIRVTRKITPGQRKLWLGWIDRIIDGRLDRKGIVHSVSYAARNYIMENSRHRDMMITHETDSAASVVLNYMASPPPLVLVSPSVTTGWDFPHDLCRYQILTKTPWPNMGDKVLILRGESDPEYAVAMMAQQLVQAVGRGNRAEDDFCENFLVDWGFARFASRKCPRDIRDLFPLYFWDLLRWIDVLPAPPVLGSWNKDARGNDSPQSF